MPQNFRPTIRSAGERARYWRQYALLLQLDDLGPRDVGARRDGARAATAH